MFNNNLLMGAAAAASGGASLVSVGNSALYVSGNSEKLTKTYASAGNRRTWTFSTWVYRGKLGTSQGILSADVGAGNWAEIRIHSTDYLWVYFQNAGDGNFQTSPLLRDIGWYHIVVALDTTEAVPGDRCKIYINNERVTTFVATTNPSLNLEQAINDDVAHNIGWTGSGSEYLDGYLAETVFIDGLQLAPTSFGAYDSSGLYWTPLSSTTIKALTFGDNGSYLDNTTNAQTDASGEGNNWTNNNTVTTVSTHTPTLLSNLWNNLVTFYNGSTFSNGNRTVVTGSSEYSSVQATIPIHSGKWYCEVVPQSSEASKLIGLTKGLATATTQPLGSLANDVGYYGNGNLYMNGASAASYGASYAQDDVIGMAINLDDNQLTYYKNGASQGVINLPAASTVNTPYFVACAHWWSAGTGQYLLRSSSSDWTGTAPTGYKEITTATLASTTTRTASDTTKYFETILYEGNGTFQRVGQFQPFTDSFTIANSAVFNHSGYLTRTQSSPTDQDVWTLSWWMKASNPAALVNGVFGVATANQDIIYYTTALIYLVLSAATEFSRDIDDSSQWQHIMFTNNSGTLGFYWNGQSQGSASGSQHSFNSAVEHSIGSYNGGSGGIGGNPMAAYMADVIFVDGTVHPVSVFGQTDTTSGRWVPKDPTTTLDEASDFGNNGYFLNFANSSDMGNDVSGNNHDWTTNNTISQSTDTPTSNFAILAPEFCYASPKSGNLVADGYAAASSNTTGLGVQTGKWYWELTMGSTIGTPALGIVPEDEINKAEYPGQSANSFGWYDTAIYRNNGSIYASYFDASPTNSQVQSIALDLDSNPQTVTFRKANTAGAAIPIPPNKVWHPTLRNGAAADASNVTLNFGASDFTYTPPTDHLALKQDNIASSDQFISAFSWIKNRDATDNHMLFDRVRGVTKDIHSNTTDAQVTNVQTVQEFLAGGVQVGTDVQVNTANESYVLWNWMIEATGSGSANTAGSVNTTSTLVDTTLGCSISQFECPNDSNDFTIGHGLGAVPKVVLLKSVDDGTYNWSVFHASTMDNQDYLKLNSNAAQTDYGANIWGAAVPTSTVIGITANVAVLKNTTCMCYAFADSQFIATGKYTGNGNANGTFVPTVNSLGVPIQPIFLLYKDIGNANSWCIADTKRSPFNVGDDVLFPDATDVEQTNSINNLDIVTGGLKFRTTYNRSNGSSYNYIYMAIGTPIIDTDGRIIAGR